MAFYRRECSNITAIIHRFSLLIPIRTLLVWKLLLCVVLWCPWPTFRAVAQWCKERPSVQHRHRPSRHLGHSYQSDITTYITSEVGFAKGDAPVTCVGSSTDYKSCNVLNYVRDAKRQGPENVSLIIFDTIYYKEISYLRISKTRFAYIQGMPTTHNLSKNKKPASVRKESIM